jgi:beta-glucanase (GH16 family)
VKTAPFTCVDPLGNFTTSYAAGQVSTYHTFSQLDGRYAVRAKLPASTLPGLQETLWLWPDNALKYGPHPASGEIDFAEFYSQYAGWNIPTVHYAYNGSTTSWATNTNVTTAWPSPYNQPGMNCRYTPGAFNTYSMTWQPGRITLDINGTPCLIDNYRSTSGPAAAPFDQPFFIALTQALGVGTNAYTTRSSRLPATTLVDYVRIWK